VRGADARKIGERAGKISNKQKVAKHFTLLISDGAFASQRTDRSDQQRGRVGRPLRDPHHLPADTLGAPAAVRAYTQLKMAEHPASRHPTPLEAHALGLLDIKLPQWPKPTSQQHPNPAPGSP
jgi:hypothetical protein